MKYKIKYPIQISFEMERKEWKEGERESWQMKYTKFYQWLC